ncbi:hypothetical protein [Streptomyces sp. TRM68367]|uniref:hypothetical protein n=1 Tax=Streptomyces sp. TRM68367 TaxID=2758415 RepID=UPI00165B7327|nr:hypothetical protein [Streptomyces sp. TRM68367]MBC9731396.1 hypothetical protein [Streptomyces sp. TRM68367]
MRGHSDLTGDGKADLLARLSSTGDLYLYKGTGKAGSQLRDVVARLAQAGHWRPGDPEI